MKCTEMTRARTPIGRLCALMALLLVVGSAAAFAPGCAASAGGGAANSAADLPEGFYDRAVELIEASGEVNQLLFGAGVPTYRIGTPEAEWLGIYPDTSADASSDQSNEPTVYLLAAEEAAYGLTSEIRDAALAVYSSAYLDTILSLLFDGYAYDVGGISGGGVMIPDYSDSARGLLVAASRTSKTLERRVYDYATMRVLPPVTADRIAVEADSYLVSAPETRLTVKLVFVRENGIWLLDSPTY